MTTLRDAVAHIRHGRLGAISDGFYPAQTALSKILPRLEHLEQRVQTPSRSRLDIVSERLGHCIQLGSCEALVRSDWRAVPWVMWERSEAADYDWFLDQLFTFISDVRPRSVVRALVHAYVFYFNPERPSFTRVAKFLLTAVLTSEDRFGKKWLDLHSRCELFNTETSPRCIATLALESTDVRESLTESGLSSGQLDGGLARSSFCYAYQAVARRLVAVTDQDAARRAVENLIAWGTSTGDELRYPNLFVPMVTALLEACELSNAANETQERLVRYFVQKGGDPRLNRAHWYGVSDRAFNVAMRLLVGATLEDFARVIDMTAEKRHWEERKSFWLQYFQAGAIDDAWVAFGPHALQFAGQLNLEGQYAALHDATQQSHSALILRLDDLIIVEWSHDGRCRFFPCEAGTWTPRLYATRYDFPELHYHSVESNDFLPHQINWKARFANRIYRATNIIHPEYGRGSR